ncbi:hypothetical protein BDZ89DRAFT_1142413 [Hymenopellis radicata]|nr:hypothetical protein BDZ89DRAFT_1142413 [Hymenopellis radicata]
MPLFGVSAEPGSFLFTSDNPEVKHYQFLLDENSIIAPDGQVVSVTSVVNTTSNPKRATALLDIGFGLSQVPEHVADAFYSGYEGTELVNNTALGNIWTVPCATEVNITFNIAGRSIPIHPLDATMNPELAGIAGFNNSQGVSACLGSFQPIKFDTHDVDLVFGMSFIRNVYTLVNYGDLVPGENDTMSRESPFVQLLPTTDPIAAHSDFVAVRKHDAPNSPSSGHAAAASVIHFERGSTVGDAAELVDNTSTIAGLIPGISVGAVVAICIIVLIIFLLGRREKKQKTSDKETADSDQRDLEPTAPWNESSTTPLRGQVHVSIVDAFLDWVSFRRLDIRTRVESVCRSKVKAHAKEHEKYVQDKGFFEMPI